MLTNEEEQARILTFGQWLVEIGQSHAERWFPAEPVGSEQTALNVAFSIGQALLGAYNERKVPLISPINGLAFAIGGALGYASPEDRREALKLLNAEIWRAIRDVQADLQPKGTA